MEPFCQQTDEFLCVLAAAGDREAEECLATRYSRLVRVCARPYFLAGGDSEDLLQEGMIGLLSAIRGFRPEKEAVFRTYAEVCIRNRVLSAVKTATREKHSPLNDSVSIDSPQFDGGPYRVESSPADDPEDALISREFRESQMSALHSKLSELERTVLAFYLDGLSCREIARRVRKPLKSVDNAIQRIRRKAAPFLTSGDISVS